MKSISSKEAAKNIDAILAQAQLEPVSIEAESGCAVLLSSEEYLRVTKSPAERFLQTCEIIGARAKARGLTEEKLDDILKEDG